MSMMKISFQGFWVSQNEILNSRYLEVNEDNNGLRWRKIGLTIRYLGTDISFAFMIISSCPAISLMAFKAYHLDFTLFLQANSWVVVETIYFPKKN